MDRNIPAIFDAGVFRPLEPVELAEGTQVVVQIQGACPPNSDVIDEETKRAWAEYLDRMESMPDEGPKDGFSGRDHDKVLYGGP